MSSLTKKLESLLGEVNGHGALDLLDKAINKYFAGRIAMVSSFGTESAVLLHLVASVNPSTPILFIDTGKLFPETLDYLHTLQQLLHLENLTILAPSRADLSREDPEGILWQQNPDKCCEIRKVLPLAKAIAPYDAWISGRKQYQGATRAGVGVAEEKNGKIKINPIARWTPEDMAAYAEANGLPDHPLKAEGYLSVGCVPCTAKLSVDGDMRSGRWAGQEKTECGIHYMI
jgi:phosphoadenosine phosphosulfate reductase